MDRSVKAARKAVKAKEERTRAAREAKAQVKVRSQAAKAQAKVKDLAGAAGVPATYSEIARKDKANQRQRRRQRHR